MRLIYWIPRVSRPQSARFAIGSTSRFEPSETPLQKLLPEAPEDLVENWREVIETLRRGGFEHLL